MQHCKFELHFSKNCLCKGIIKWWNCLQIEMVDFCIRTGFTGMICVGVENKLGNLRPIAPCRSRVQCSRIGWLCWRLYQRKGRASWGKSNTKIEGRKFCILSSGNRKKANEKALLDSILLNQKGWTKNPALPHPRPIPVASLQFFWNWKLTDLFKPLLF